MSTIFTKIINREISGYIIDENDNYMAFLDAFPLVKGHVLVIPKKEVDYIFDLNDDDLSGLMLYAKKIAKAIKKAIVCERIGVTVIGLEVPHTHIHLVPINSVADINFSKEKLRIGGEELEEIKTKISKFL